MDLAVSPPAAAGVIGPAIDVLAFPPDQAELQRWHQTDTARWVELERRARLAIFLGVGMFLAWAADVGAAFEIGSANGSTYFGVASVPLALTVVLAICWSVALERPDGVCERSRSVSEVTIIELPANRIGGRDSDCTLF